MTEIPDIEIARYALRTFKIDHDKQMLRSVVAPGDTWNNGVCEAACYAPPPKKIGTFTWWLDRSPNLDPGHTSPPEDPKACGCGIYGCLSIGKLIAQYPVHCPQIVAVIAAEGKTIIGGTGLRTEYARIVAYWTPERKIRRICKQTCGDAKHFGDIAKMLVAYGFAPEKSRVLARGNLDEILASHGWMKSPLAKRKRWISLSRIMSGDTQ